MDRLLTVKDLKKIFSVEKSTIYYWVEAGKLKAYKPGGKVMLFKERDVKAFFQSGQKIA